MDETKQICFETKVKRHANLKIRLHYDELSAKEFFNEIVKGYICHDERILSFIDEVKEKKLVSKAKRKKISKSRKKAQTIKNQFALNEDEIENIFDIINREGTKI